MTCPLRARFFQVCALDLQYEKLIGFYISKTNIMSFEPHLLKKKKAQMNIYSIRAMLIDIANSMINSFYYHG